MAELPFSGYPGRVWATCWQSMTWLSNILASGTAGTTNIFEPTAAVFATLFNGVGAIDAWQTGTVLSIESKNLLGIQALNLPLDPVTKTYFETRVTAVEAAAAAVSLLPPSVDPFTITTFLEQGKPAIPDPLFLEWAMQSSVEVPPVGALLPDGSITMAQSWLTMANTISALQGANPTTAYDTAARMYRCSAVVSAALEQLASGPFETPTVISYGGPQLVDSAGNLLFDSAGNPVYGTGPTAQQQAWNWAVTTPTILLDAASLASAPATLAAQQSMVIRNALIVQMENLATLLLALRTHNIVQPATAMLRLNESLADLAARTTGSFEDWPAIAALNSLGPPFPGPTNPSLALSGRQLFISNGVGSPGVLPDPDAQQPTYASNVLGTDWDWGPINGQQPPWGGDIVLITGYLNFARAIGRRLQTPLGSLLFHTTYGSRIPPEVGATQWTDEAQRLLQYGRSAILSDPRTGSILSSEATTQPGFLATFAAAIQPIGPGSSPVSINETIGATP